MNMALSTVWAAAWMLLGSYVAYLIARLSVTVARMRKMQRVVGRARGPRPLPIIGNALDLMGPLDRFLPTMVALMERYEPSFVLWVGPACFVCTADPHDYEFVLNDPKFNDKSPFYSGIHTALGKGLIVLSGPQWRRHRKAAAPSFNQQALAQYVEVFQRKARHAADVLLQSAAASGAPFNIKQYCCLVSMDAVCETMLSADMSGQHDALEKFIHSTHGASARVSRRFAKPWLLVDWVYGLTKEGRSEAEVTRETNRFVDEIISSREGDGFKPQDEGHKRRFFLQHVLADPTAASLLSGEALREEAKSMVIAGEGSVANTLSFALLMLAMHPDVQRAVHKELLDVFGEDPDSEVTPDDLRHLPLLERVVLETLRLFPVAAVFARHCPEDTVLPSGVTAPQGSHLSFWTYCMHRDPKLYSNPLQFDPNRFLPDGIRSRPPHSFAAFSAGPRACLGQRYAMMYVKTVLSTVLRRFQVHRVQSDTRTVADLPVKIGVILSLDGGFPVTVSQ